MAVAGWIAEDRRAMKQRSYTEDGAAAPRGIVVGDILRCLSAVADMQRDARTGNAAFADAIRIFADALKPHRARPVPDLIELLAGLSARKVPEPVSRRVPVELPSGLTTLPGSAVERVLADDRYLKSQLAELGFQRFGISRSRLCRLNKTAAVDAIRGALEHERSLDAIGRQAQVAAKRRSRVA